MHQYSPRLLSLPVLFLWAGEALACGAVVPDETASPFSSFGFETSLSLIPLLMILLLNAVLMLLTYIIRKFILKKSIGWADLCWPTALANFLLLGGIGIFVIPSFVSLYEGLGVDLPALTQLIIGVPQALWALPFVVALFVKCIVFKGSARQARLTRVWVAIQLVALLLVATLVLALYLSIFKLC